MAHRMKIQKIISYNQNLTFKHNSKNISNTQKPLSCPISKNTDNITNLSDTYIRADLAVSLDKFKKLAREVLTSKFYDLTPSQKEEIIKNITPYNFDILKDLLSIKSAAEENKYIKRQEKQINDCAIAQILELTKKGKDIDIAKKLINASHKQGAHGLTLSRIYKALSVVNDDNRACVDTILEAGKALKHKGVLYCQFKNILKVMNKDNDACLKTLVNAKNEDNSQRFQTDDIINILSKINGENSDCLNFLLDSKNYDYSLRFSPCEIEKILKHTTSKNKISLKLLTEAFDKKEPMFLADEIATILKYNASSYYLKGLIDECSKKEITSDYIVAGVKYNIDVEEFKAFEKTLDKSTVRNLKPAELNKLFLFKDIINKKSADEIPPSKRRNILKNIVKYNIELFEFSKKIEKYIPLLPKNKEEYCALLSKLTSLINIQKDKIPSSKLKNLYESVFELSKVLASLDDKEFNNLEISQEYSTKQLAKDIHEAIKDLSREDRQKIYNHFNFELAYNEYTQKYDILGYPAALKDGDCSFLEDNSKNNLMKKKILNLFKFKKGDDTYSRVIGSTNNPTCHYDIKSLKNLIRSNQIRSYNDTESTTNKESDKTKIVETITNLIDKYYNNNKIICNNKEIENLLSEILNPLCELRTMISKRQHSTHEADLLKHSLKVMQKVVQNPMFSSLNSSDKKIMLLGSLFHDISKKESMVDRKHPEKSALESHFLLQKLNLTNIEQYKLYSLIRYHQWFGDINKAGYRSFENQIISTAYDLQYDNLFELSKIFTIADLKAVKRDNSFYDDKKDIFKDISKKVEEKIMDFKATQPLLPVTKFPSASRIRESIKYINKDYSTNLKGVYVDEKGLVIIKFNEVSNEVWEKIGFDKNTVSKGITAPNINTGNIKFFVHGFEDEWELLNFYEFSLPDSNALLSTTYCENPESKFRFYKPQGVIINTQTQNIHGGGKNDSGSGFKKSVEAFKRRCIIDKDNQDRTFISDLIKKSFNFDDMEYINFLEENKNKSFTQINQDTSNKLIRVLSTIKPNIKFEKRNYNEFFVSNPEIMAVYAYSSNAIVGNIKDFMQKQKNFLKDYARENDKAFVVFGN